MKKTPIGDRVIVKPDAAIKVSESGFELPDESVARPQEGEAIAVGDKCTQVKKGSRVTYGKFAGQVIPIDGEDYLIMREAEILAVE
jgi:chaperonin GroES